VAEYKSVWWHLIASPVGSNCAMKPWDSTVVVQRVWWHLIASPVGSITVQYVAMGVCSGRAKSMVAPYCQPGRYIVVLLCSEHDIP
jgi:hypothetical protein